MRRVFTFSSLVKKFFAVVCLCIASVTDADALNYTYYYYTQLDAYPSGAGLVYAEEPNAATVKNDLDQPFADMTTPAESIDIKFAYILNSATYTAHALPADGWIVAGFSKADTDADGNFTFNDVVLTSENPGSISLASDVQSEGSAVDELTFPLTPQAKHYALFTHVAPKVAWSQDSLGTVKASKVVNYIGDEVTFTATPQRGTTTAFDYWVNKTTGEKLTANPLTVTVSDTAYYEAHFKSDSAVVVTFPEEGGYAIVYNDSALYMPYGIERSYFEYNEGYDSLCVDETTGKDYWEPNISMYYLNAKEPHILYGKGEVTLLKTGDGPRDTDDATLKWSGESGVAVSSLAAACHYYTINFDKKQFELLADDATIPANTAYYALENARYEALKQTSAPAIIYWENPSAATGIEKVSVDNDGVKKSAKGIYTIGGQKVGKVSGKGLYIIDGKKVLVLGK